MRVTLKTRRRQVMSKVGYEQDRIYDHGEGTFSYKRSGPLLRAEMLAILDAIDERPDAPGNNPDIRTRIREEIPHLNPEKPGDETFIHPELLTMLGQLPDVEDDDE